MPDSGPEADVHLDSDADIPDAQPDADGAAIACSLQGACPSSLPGAKLVRIPCVSGGAYCMDATEVTRRDYSDFLAAGVSTGAQPSECGSNSSYAPDADCEAEPDVTSEPDHPQVCADWCDALAYCTWAGKRLCAGAWEGYDQASADEWYNACSEGGKRTYCYGSDFAPAACDDYALGAGTTVPVGSLTTCEGGFGGLFDMSGNADEWTANCGVVGGEDVCASRGGAYIHEESYLDCASGGAAARNYVSPRIGFRCCY